MGNHQLCNVRRVRNGIRVCWGRAVEYHLFPTNAIRGDIYVDGKFGPGACGAFAVVGLVGPLWDTDSLPSDCSGILLRDSRVCKGANGVVLLRGDAGA